MLGQNFFANIDLEHATIQTKIEDIEQQLETLRQQRHELEILQQSMLTIARAGDSAIDQARNFISLALRSGANELIKSFWKEMENVKSGEAIADLPSDSELDEDDDKPEYQPGDRVRIVRGDREGETFWVKKQTGSLHWLIENKEGFEIETHYQEIDFDFDEPKYQPGDRVRVNGEEGKIVRLADFGYGISRGYWIVEFENGSADRFHYEDIESDELIEGDYYLEDEPEYHTGDRVRVICGERKGEIFWIERKSEDDGYWIVSNDDCLDSLHYQDLEWYGQEVEVLQPQSVGAAAIDFDEMSLQELKDECDDRGIDKERVREFGPLTRRSTWIAALYS